MSGPSKILVLLIVGHIMIIILAVWLIAIYEFEPQIYKIETVTMNKKQYICSYSSYKLIKCELLRGEI